MRLHLIPLALAVVAAAVAAPVPVVIKRPAESDWPTWRGADRSGVSKEKNLRVEWPADGPPLAWKKTELTDVGTGYGSPAVVGGRVYLLGADGAKKDANEFVTCLDVDGKQLWQTALKTTPGKYVDGFGGGPRSTPTVDGKSVFVLGATGDLVALNADTGETRWSKNLPADFGGEPPQWGYSESVTVDGNQVVFTPGGKGGMVALDKATGKLAWQCTDVSDAAGYSSIVVTDVGGVRQYVTQTMAAGVGVRAKDGKLLWRVGEIARKTAVIPTPVVSDDGHVFFTAGYGAGCECYKLSKDGDGTTAEKVYTKSKAVTNHYGGVVRVGDFVYGYSDVGGWVCYEFKKGPAEPAWKDKGVGKGSITATADWLFCYAEANGKLARVKVDANKYEEHGSLTIPQTSKLRPGSGKVWAHPVVSGGKLYLRDYELLFVYDLAEKK